MNLRNKQLIIDQNKDELINQELEQYLNSPKFTYKNVENIYRNKYCVEYQNNFQNENKNYKNYISPNFYNYDTKRNLRFGKRSDNKQIQQVESMKKIFSQLNEQYEQQLQQDNFQDRIINKNDFRWYNYQNNNSQQSKLSFQRYLSKDYFLTPTHNSQENKKFINILEDIDNQNDIKEAINELQQANIDFNKLPYKQVDKLNSYLDSIDIESLMQSQKQIQHNLSGLNQQQSVQIISQDKKNATEIKRYQELQLEINEQDSNNRLKQSENFQQTDCTIANFSNQVLNLPFEIKQKRSESSKSSECHYKLNSPLKKRNLSYYYKKNQNPPINQSLKKDPSCVQQLKEIGIIDSNNQIITQKLFQIAPQINQSNHVVFNENGYHKHVQYKRNSVHQNLIKSQQATNITHIHPENNLIIIQKNEDLIFLKKFAPIQRKIMQKQQKQTISPQSQYNLNFIVNRFQIS